jgi:hypothetical protein
MSARPRRAATVERALISTTASAAPAWPVTQAPPARLKSTSAGPRPVATAALARTLSTRTRAPVRPASRASAARPTSTSAPPRPAATPGRVSTSTMDSAAPALQATRAVSVRLKSMSAHPIPAVYPARLSVWTVSIVGHVFVMPAIRASPAAPTSMVRISVPPCPCTKWWADPPVLLPCCLRTTECASSPCINSGTCVDGVNLFTCNCLPGYVGHFCQTDVAECASSPCSLPGTIGCVDQVNGWTCTCAVGYSGALCQTDINGTRRSRSRSRAYSPLLCADSALHEMLRICRVRVVPVLTGRHVGLRRRRRRFYVHVSRRLYGSLLRNSSE